MDALLELLFSFLGEFVVELIPIAVVRVGQFIFDVAPNHPVLAALRYVVVGAMSAGASLFFAPHAFIHRPELRILSLVVTPVLAGGCNALIGGVLPGAASRGTTRLQAFIDGVLCALVIGATRFFWAR